MLLIGLIGWSPAGWAQQMTVTGQVTEDGFGIPGVNISIKGTSTGTVSDAQGNYSLSVPSGNVTLVFSFIGYTTQEVPLNGRATLDVNMAADVKQLSEIVVVGYGTQKKQDVTGAVEQVSSKDFNGGINTNPLQSIQGKVAGLNITQPSGDPTTQPTVRLRGYTSLGGGSDPLYVVDGIIGVPINSVSPSDIASIDVLKDASAAAIYGSRAANGVIIVTTKRGKEGTASVSFDNYVAVETISRRLDLLDAGSYRDQVSRILPPDEAADAFADLRKFPLDASGNGYSTDWIDQITRTAYTNNHDLAVMGGNENFSYRGSLNYINRGGIIKNTGFDRLTGRINLDQRALKDKLRVQYNLSVSNSNSKLVNNDVIGRAILYLPTLPILNPLATSETTNPYYEIAGDFDLFNPVAMQENYLRDEVFRVLIGGVNLNYEIFNGLSVGVNGAYRNESRVRSEAYDQDIKAYLGKSGGDNTPNQSDFAASRRLEQVNNYLLEVTAQYQKAFGASNSLNLLAGYSYQNNVNDGFQAGNFGYIEGLYSIFGYNNLGQGRGSYYSGRGDYTDSYKNDFKLISFFGRANLSLLDRFNVTATLRRDGSSKFGANEKWGLFPSLAGGWVLSNESFLQNSSWLNFLKLRVGWGQTGNSEGIRAYQSLLLYGPSGTYYDGNLGAFVPGYGVIQNTNPNLKWEILEQTNVGVDFTLFRGLTGTVEVYSKLTKDMLFNYNVPADGTKYFVNSILANVGKMRNRGIELSLGGDAIKGTNFTWNTRVVGTALQNEIVSLKGGDFDVGVIRYNAFGGRGLSEVYASQLREGHPFGEFYIPHFVGFNEAGEVLLEAEEAGAAPVTDRTKAKLYEAGKAIPTYTASWINTLQYKNFDLTFQLRGVFGNKILNNLRSNLTIPGSILQSNMLREVTDYPTNYSINQLSDLWLENGAFVRLDNWQLGYNVPITEGKTFTNARVYVGGNNLFIITKYTGIDPELQVRGDLENTTSQRPNSIGIDDRNIYPKTRSFQLGLNLTF